MLAQPCPERIGIEGICLVLSQLVISQISRGGIGELIEAIEQNLLLHGEGRQLALRRGRVLGPTQAYPNSYDDEETFPAHAR